MKIGNVRDKFMFINTPVCQKDTIFDRMKKQWKMLIDQQKTNFKSIYKFNKKAKKVLIYKSLRWLNKIFPLCLWLHLHLVISFKLLFSNFFISVFDLSFFLSYFFLNFFSVFVTNRFHKFYVFCDIKHYYYQNISLLYQLLQFSHCDLESLVYLKKRSIIRK